MSKVLFFSIPLQGHTNPTLPLVKELVRRGEEVTYDSLEPLRSAIEQTGATFRSYGASYEALPPPDNAFDGMSRVIIHRSPKILAQLLPEVRDFQPDYILHDALALWGKCRRKIKSYTFEGMKPAITCLKLLLKSFTLLTKISVSSLSATDCLK